MLTVEEKSVLKELVDKEVQRIHREFKHMDSIGDSFYINEGLIFENMHVRKKLETRLAILEGLMSKLDD